jgi:peptidoglycan/xylan/chitin deacetylase (PgdA/CDA1 family)
VSTVVRLLGSGPVSLASGFATQRRLRGLAYHVVDDPQAFGRQLDWFVSQGYRAVTGAEIADSIASGQRLPDRSLWITFDDGDPSVVNNALPMLTARGMRATAFLCGAWVGTNAVPWWTAVEAAVAHGVVRADDLPDHVDVHDLIAVRLSLKRCPDPIRRRAVAAFEERLAEAGWSAGDVQWSVGQLNEWLAAGNDVGNHSWDHPCLDQCDADEQRRQVRLAHERLTELVGRPIDVFAWPNGDPAPAARKELDELGYRLVADCDHRLVSRRPEPRHVSRLRLDTSADIPRTRAIVSGAHSLVFHVQRRITGRGDSHAVT